jgi:hypothetical protein
MAGWSKLVSSAIILIEIYKVFFGSALVVFAPDVCEDHRCNPFENYARGNTVYHIGVWLNAATLVCFAALYYVEMKREHKLTHYLFTNHQFPTDNASVAHSIQKLTDDRQTIIYRYNNLYKRIGYITLALFSVNTVLSGCIIFREYLDDKSGVALVTNTLFIGSKLYDIYGIVNTEKHVFLSAYTKHKVQFNDVQPNKVRPSLADMV